jgi:hypothetical protein
MLKTDFLNIYSLDDLHDGLKNVKSIVKRVDLNSFSPYTIHSPQEIDAYVKEHVRQ